MVLYGRGRISHRDGSWDIHVSKDLSAGSQWFFAENEEVLIELSRENQILVIRKKPTEDIERVRDELKFSCPKCNEYVKPPFSSRLLYAVANGSRSVADALNYLKIAHYRHKHTDYEEQVSRLEKDSETYSVALEQTRIFANMKAKELLKEDEKKRKKKRTRKEVERAETRREMRSLSP